MENSICLREIGKREFQTFGDAELIWFCIEPVIDKIRGKNISIKEHAYARLTEGQRVLLMFQILYGHTSGGVKEFFHGSYYLDKQGFWPQLKQAIAKLGDMTLPPLIDEIELTYNMIKRNRENTEQYCKSVKYEEIVSKIAGIDESLCKAMPETVKLAAAYIRRNPDEFVEMKSI